MFERLLVSIRLNKISVGAVESIAGVLKIKQGHSERTQYIDLGVAIHTLQQEISREQILKDTLAKETLETCVIDEHGETLADLVRALRSTLERIKEFLYERVDYSNRSEHHEFLAYSMENFANLLSSLTSASRKISMESWTPIIQK